MGVFEPYPFNSPGAGIILTPHRRALLFIDLLNNFILDSTAGILGLRDGVGVGSVDTRGGTVRFWDLHFLITLHERELSQS